MREAAGRRPSEWERTSPSIAVSIAPGCSPEVRRYGIIGGTLEAVDKLLKKLSSPGVELRLESGTKSKRQGGTERAAAANSGRV